MKDKLGEIITIKVSISILKVSRGINCSILIIIPTIVIPYKLSNIIRGDSTIDIDVTPLAAGIGSSGKKHCFGRIWAYDGYISNAGSKSISRDIFYSIIHPIAITITSDNNLTRISD